MIRKYSVGFLHGFCKHLDSSVLHSLQPPYCVYVCTDTFVQSEACKWSVKDSITVQGENEKPSPATHKLKPVQLDAFIHLCLAERSFYQHTRECQEK